ncbi:MAG: NADH-quinone oxidoreductase subunit L [Candidatus Dormibacteraeota bacterium]|uniref:NADH-quinone oxidoreductase subunit L n=1 Tax=Candidatus Amunia macphersoniae TaxID=3127014 RepID=A0A934KL41_9BACT|nr:NADH-quinone oxidoreductase subunit L [Candidatus Dormibacteraeota bacterium]
MTTSTVAVLSGLILLLPLAGALLNALVGWRLSRRVVNAIGTGSILAAFLVACVMLAQVVGAPDGAKSASAHLWQWLDLGTGGLRVGVDVTLDPLSAVMLMVITGVGLLIHVYSVGYMEHDRGIARFFSYMNLFIFSMLVLVLAADLLILIIGWALVALSSYLLIGFWYERPSAVVAARKAFITQVAGDVALVIAAFLIVVHIGTLSMPGIFAAAPSFASGGLLITVVCSLLAIGAFAKSAQFPLHTWLPDAMEGPTPVSALIHAATMVTAGVYLIARFHPLFDRAPVAQGMVACVGIGTAVMAGVIALSQVDIKRVIAYSTMSQIGLMIFAVGIGAYSAGMFHLATHAVFKALLFMAAGNVIHALHDEQDIRLMGGLSTNLRRTELCFLSGTFALAGIPLFAGFFSKEGLLGFGLTNGPGAFPWVLYLVGVGINVLTGLYAFRLWATVFRGEPQTARVYAAREAPRVMLVPVAILALLSAFLGLILGVWSLVIHDNFLIGVFARFLSPVFTTPASGPLAVDLSTGTAILAGIVGTLGSLLGAGLAARIWLQRNPDPSAVTARLPRALPQLAYNKFYFDEIYDALLVRPLVALARAARRVVEPRFMNSGVQTVSDACSELGAWVRDYQTGLIRDYASYMIAAAGVFVVATLVLVSR